MPTERLFSIIAIAALTLISGIADAQGALWASRLWDNDRFNVAAMLRSALGFGASVGVYFLTIRFFRNLGIVAPELQTAIYIGGTLITVALFSRVFFRWQTVDQVVAVLVLVGIVWLSVRTAAE